MLRDEATETSDTVPEVKRKMKRAEMYGGKSFGKMIFHYRIKIYYVNLK